MSTTLMARTTEAIQKAPYLQLIYDRLLSIGGTSVVLWNGSNGPRTVEHLLADGVLFEQSKIKLRKGANNRCHENVWKLLKKSSDDYLIITGYALGGETWRPHSWGFLHKTKTIIETTGKQEAYFGVIFSKAEFEESGNAVEVQL